MAKKRQDIKKSSAKVNSSGGTLKELNLNKVMVTLMAVSGFALSSMFLIYDKGYWDNVRFFSIFRDFLHALNNFGEIPWWFPHNQFGWPGYYYGVLGDINVGSPVFVTLGLGAFVLGKLGIHFQSYMDLFCLYFAALMPALFILATRYFLSALFTSSYTISFGMILAAFAPGVMLNLSDVGFLEPLVYFLLYAGSLIRFLKLPTSRSFGTLILTLSVLSLTFNYTSLFFNVCFVPIFTVMAALYPRWQMKRSLRAFLLIPKWQLALGFGLVGFCLIPNLIVLSQAGDLVRSTMGEKYYNPMDIKAGNPIEVLLISIPFFGFEWIKEVWKIRFGQEHIAYAYMGLLSLPLLIYGLLKGGGVANRRVLYSLLAGFGVINLASMSPFFSAILILPTPLRGNSHFGDAFFRAGGFLIAMYAAIYGFDLLRRRPDLIQLKKICIASFAITTLVFIAFLGRDIFASWVFGLHILVGISLVVCFSKQSLGGPLRPAVLRLILLVMTLDVSTVAFFYIRDAILRRGLPATETAGANNIGTIDGLTNHYANTILTFRPLLEMNKAKVPLQELPTVKLFKKVHVNEDMGAEFGEGFSFSNYTNLQISQADAQQQPFAGFVGDASPGPEVSGSIGLVSRSYNSLVLQVRSSESAILFLKDSHSPYWRAKVNGEEQPIAKALYNFKAIIVPSGDSTVEMRFSPPYVGMAFVLAYLLLLGLAVSLYRARGSLREEGLSPN